MPCVCAQTQLRAQLLSQLQRGQVLRLGPPAGDKPSLRRRAVNHMIAGYLDAAAYSYSLSVFREESAVSDGPALMDDELLEVLHIDRNSFLHTAMAAAKAQGERAGAAIPICTCHHDTYV